MARKRHELVPMRVLTSALFVLGCSLAAAETDSSSVIRDFGPRSLDTWFQEAVAHQDARDLVERTRNGTLTHIMRGTPEFVSWQYQKSTHQSQNLSRMAVILEQVSRRTLQRSVVPKNQSASYLNSIDLTSSNIAAQCPVKPKGPCAASKYRSFDASCNNVENADWGKSYTPFGRLTAPEYPDGISMPRMLSATGGLLPSAKTISEVVHQNIGEPHQSVNLLLPVWAQLIEEDLAKVEVYSSQSSSALSCCAGSAFHPECFPVLQTPNSFDSKCFEYLRSLPGVQPKCQLGPRQQMNAATHFLDGSAVYGSTVNYALFTSNGRFWMGPKESNTPFEYFICKEDSKMELGNRCNNAALAKMLGNGYTPLIALKTLLMKEHNRVADELEKLTGWHAERVFEEARRIVIAQIQQITYHEFLPLVLGISGMIRHELLEPSPKESSGFANDYARISDPSINAEVAVAALKFWHSMLDDVTERVYPNNTRVSRATGKEFYDLGKAATSKEWLVSYSVGLLTQSAKRSGAGVAKQLTTKYLRGEGEVDLVMEAIQRGRDHGVAGYNRVREACGLSTFQSFEDLSSEIPSDVVEKLQTVYRTIEDIDLYTGGMAEIPQKGALIGPLFSCLLGHQFSTLKAADRFWYERDLPPSGFSSDQLIEIRKLSLASLFCRNTEIAAVQPDAFLRPDDSLNALVPCGSVPDIDFRKWIEKPVESVVESLPASSNITESDHHRVKRQGFRGPQFARQGRQLAPVNQFQNVDRRDDTCGERGKACEPNRKFRSASGVCNNLDHPNWGSINQLFTRFVAADYDDGRDEMRRSSVLGGSLPPVRGIRTTLHADVDRPHPKYTTMMVAFGQFLDHDMTNTPFATGPGGSFLSCADCNSEQSVSRECRPIRVPQGDPVMASNDRFGKPLCLSFTRSAFATEPSGHRGQMNQLSAYLDAGNIYGHSACVTRKVRSFNGGGLLMTRNPVGGKPLMKQSTDRNDVESQECKNRNGQPCFFAGDARSNEHPVLSAKHTMWAREHNRVAATLAALNPSWNDDRIFEETRRIVIAELQHVTYNEYLPRVVGQPVANLFGIALQKSGFYKDYEDTCNAGISNEFSTAAFRFGHSLVPFRFGLYNNQFENIGQFNLFEHFSRVDILYDQLGVDKVLTGLTIEPVQNADFSFTQALSNRLFQDANRALGTDLIAINIQRGRDHGLPGYNAYREKCNMTRARTFDDLLGDIPKLLVDKLAEVYRHVDDIDLYAGGNAELPVIGGMVGPTFSCIIAEQFLRLRKCDRYWYETSDPLLKFTSAQLAAIRKVSLAKIVCENSDSIDRIQRNIFDQPDTFQNAHVLCDDLPSLDLNAWRESTGCSVSGQQLQVGERKRVSPCVSCTCTANGADCRSLNIESCQDLRQEFSERDILNDDVCRVQCSKDFLS